MKVCRNGKGSLSHIVGCLYFFFSAHYTPSPAQGFKKLEHRVIGFAKTFQDQIWPGIRLPSVFYDPRALSLGFGPKACLHAKCVVIDDHYLLITSANFTEAAHKRNLEAGILLDDPIAARSIQSQFDNLLKSKRLRPLKF